MDLIKKTKCIFGHCEHGEEFHDEGVCWKITQPDLENLPTTAKYCPCKQQPELIRRYERLGYMEREEHDQMITRACKGCGRDFLFTIHDKYCTACKIKHQIR
jgi:hypothetical protein